MFKVKFKAKRTLLKNEAMQEIERVCNFEFMVRLTYFEFNFHKEG